MSEEEDPWRERGRAALVGLILAFGVVAMVLLGRQTEQPSDAWPAFAGIYEVGAECEGCGCEPTEAEGFAVLHPGLPTGRPSPVSCENPNACVAILDRRAPPNVRAPIVLGPDSDPDLVARELDHGPPLASEGEGYEASVDRERRDSSGCVRVRRVRRLVPLANGGWRWVERYESAAGAECPAEEGLACIGSFTRRMRPIAR